MTLSEGSACILFTLRREGAASVQACKMQALPTRIATIPATWIQFLELLFGVGKMGVAELHDFWRSGQEGLFRGDAIHPALLGEFFMVGEAEAEEKLDGFVGFGSFGFVLGFRFPFCLGFFGFGGYGFRGGFAVGGAFEFEEQLFVQAKSLLPSFQFMAGKLGFFFVVAEVELHVNVRHGFSL